MSTHLHAALITLALTVAPSAAQSPAESNPRIAELRQWMTLAAQHTPGRVDEAVAAVRSWESESLQSVRDDLAAIRLLLCERCAKPAQADKFRTDHLKVGGQLTWRTVYASKHISELRAFIKQLGDQFNVNDLLKRGALLHTDIALRAPPIMTWASTATYSPLRRTLVHVADGQQSGVDEAVDHLEMARRLLELVTADPRADLQAAPGRDQMVRTWYRATMAALLDRDELDLNHTRAALQLLPDEGTVLFLAAAQHETLASPRFQRAVATRTIGDASVIESEEQELRRAEELFQRSLKADPEYLEARLRRGQVLGRLGRHADALAELKAASQTTDPLLSYYIQLLIGREEDALGNVANARAAYERAAALFAHAQAPRLALSEIEMRSGNRATARQWLDGALGAPGSSPPADPWTSYLQAAGRAGGALLTSIGAAFSSVPARP